MSRRITGVAALILLSVFAQAGVVQAINSKSALVVWWTLDEGKGTVAVDHSGNGYNGVFKGEPQWAVGYEGSGLRFDGIDDYVAFDFPAAESMPAFTVSLWLKCETLGQDNYSGIFAGHYPNTAGFQLDVNGGNPGDYRVNPSGLIFGPASTEWVHLVLAAQGTSATLYYNGVQAAAGSLSDAMWDEFCLGVNRNRANWWAGTCDDLRVYNRTMEAGQVQALYQGITPDFSKAIAPGPADGAILVTIPLFSWKPGDGAVLHDLYIGTSPDLTEANRVVTRTPLTMHYYVPGLQPGVRYYWRVDEVEADMATVHTGDLWSFTSQALTAHLPEPADGSVEAATTPKLTWLPGQQAATHRVYFSDKLADVNAATAAADKGEATEPSFAPGELAGVTTYYWRVDETVFGGTVRAGPVWKFTTVQPVEDFESYTDEQGNSVFDIWADGYVNNTGSTVGLYPNSINGTFCETTIVHGGKQSMPFEYNDVKAPYYSETTRTFDTAQNWTTGGIEALTLHLRGSRSNAAEPVYVVLEDSTGKAAVVTNPDPEAAKAPVWTPWRIPLGQFAGVNLSRVKKMTLGVGDRANPTPGGAGRIYFDDIWLSVAP